MYFFKAFRFSSFLEKAVASTLKLLLINIHKTINSDWKKTSDSFELTTEIPINTQAIVYLPAANKNKISESGKPVNEAKDIQFVKMEEGKAVFKTGSGKYNFKSW